MIINRHFTQLTILAIAVGYCCSTRAQSLCTADLPHQPPKLKTLLCQGVDDIVHVSTRYRGDISGLQRALPIDYEKIGYLFCEKNTHSVTHQNYLDYYGDWWTQNYGRAALAAIPVSGDAVFWSKITLLANRAAQGSHALEEVWPTPQVPLRREESGALASLVGDEAGLSRRISVTSSEIRLRSSDHDKAAVASLALSGVCVGLNEVKAHYPDAVATGSPHPGVAGAKATWTAYGDWGGLWFAFPADNPKCLSGVSFHPGEVDASADDRLYPPR